MKITKRLMFGSGGIVLAAMVVVLLAPKTAHAVVATLVQVANTPSSPVPNRDIDNPALQPWHMLLKLTNPTPYGSQFAYSGQFNVPANKRLVIETTSLTDNNPGPYLGEIGVSTSVGGQYAPYGLPLQFGLVVISGQTYPFAYGTLSARFYADPGTTVFASYVVSSNGDTEKDLSISGYYITP